ncbi:MAG: cation:proton antiporter [Firmicutes bacterium]|nr:cation:proton antiporter [Bacillota bacterium]MCM1401303.1 cation:proton antiporter [Bacteroides sp.]MCM1476742.1 cation:proton antiporter [Bacteroides sp.]
MTLASILLTATTAASNAPEIQIESLISDLAFLLILAAVTTLFFKWIKQPVVLGYIVAGFLASPNFSYLPSITTEQNIEFWAQLGIVILLFSLGLEFSFKKLINAGGSAVVTALIIVMGMMCCGFAIGRFLGFTNINSLFLGGMLSMSSTTIIIKAFNDLHLTHKKFSSLVFAVLIVEDLFAVVMMVVLSSIAINNSVAGGEMLMNISKLVFFLVIWFAVGVFILPSLLNLNRRYLNSETLLIVSMGLCLGMAVFSVYCGFSLALGAFVMGSILAGTSFAERIEHVTTPVKDLFGAIFFISVGMMVNPHVIVQYAGPILILSAVVIVGMIIFGTTGMLVTGQSLKVAIESGFSLTQIGEFAFIIATLGMQLGVLDSSIYPIVVAVSVLTTFTTPYFIRMADPVYNFVERILPEKLHFLIDRYSDKASNESESGLLWKTVLKRYLWRILLYSSVLIAITLISRECIYPILKHFFPNWGRFLSTLVTFFIMAPFLIALSYPASKKTERERLIKANARFDLPLIVMTFFRLFLSLGFVIWMLKSFYSWGVAASMGLVVFLLLIFVLSRKLRTKMRSIEKKFLNNLNERELRRSGRNNNVISNLHLAFMTVSYACPMVGRRLLSSGLRTNYGVSVASIQRGSKLITAPDGETRIFPGDVLGVIGTDDEIQRLIPVIEAPVDDNDNGPSPSDYKLTSIQLSNHSPLIGKTVAESQLSTAYNALLVSVMRGEEFMNPDPTTRFQPHDILWLVANPDQLAPLK